MLLLYLLVAHFLCDFPLQGDFLARGKNHRKGIPGVPWCICLLAHAAIQGGSVALVTDNPVLGICEFATHLAIDHAKCDEAFGFSTDQALHLFCRLLWFVAALYWR